MFEVVCHNKHSVAAVVGNASEFTVFTARQT